MIGHVDHGKTTLTQALSGVWTDRHSEEIKRGISIRLGYADSTFKKCPDCDDPECYTTYDKCVAHNKKPELLRSVSFVDSPGHETLMATMLSGAAIMDGAVLVIAANEECPQPQTKEHLMALDIIGVKNIVIAQNKIDIVSEERVREHYQEIKDFVKGTAAEDVPIIPIAAMHDANIDYLIQAIEEVIPTPDRDDTKPARMYIARSFDVNKPGMRPEEIKGGVVGGSLTQGKLKKGDEVQIAPGVKIEEENKIRWEPITTLITNLMAGSKSVKNVTPGGLVGIGTHLDPSLTKSDGLSGSVMGIPGTLPPILEKITIEVHLLKQVVGTEDEIDVDAIKTGEPLMLSVGTTTTVGVVTSARKKEAELRLKLPVCAEESSRVAISRRIGARWRLIGYGILK
jgi:translation initiation factor 2 subunit 3